MEKVRKQYIKYVKDLLRKKEYRDSERVIVAEGSKIVADALRKERGILSVLFSGKVLGSPLVKEINSLCVSRDIKVFRVPPSEFDKLSSLKSSQGVLALLNKPEWKDFEPGDICVLCDGVQDPGNLGAIIRTSCAFGVSAVFLYGSTVDVFNPKVVRSSSGSVLDIPVLTVNEEDLDALSDRGYFFLIASARREGADEMSRICVPQKPAMIVFGNEGKGVSRSLSRRAGQLFYIPIGCGTESLNVTAAAAIAIHYFAK